MATDDDPYSHDRMDHVAPAGLGWGHTKGKDRRTPEERAEAQRKETKRRRGKVRGREVRWWEGLD